MSKANNPFSVNFAWLLGSEGVVRLSRLITAIAIARFLEAGELGIAALVLATTELTRVLANNGFGLKIIRADSSQLAALCNSAYLLNWAWCVAIFILQVLIAWVLQYVYSQPELFTMFLVICAANILVPLSLVHMFRLQRKQRLREMAIIDSSQVIVDNLLTAVLAILGFGVWAILIPKVLVVPIWVISYRYCECR